jgi:cyclophilin family peptidyl-prolyl cis-trans isomerase
MTRKSKMLGMVLAAAIIVAGAVAIYLNNREAASPEAPAPEATSSQATTTVTNEGENKVPNYDLTTEADGLSKAVATMTLENGSVIKWRFFTNDAPNTVKRIAQLISEGFYNGIIFHRVVPGFVVQAGDPTGTGTSGSGVKLKAEFNQHKHEPGIVSMARTADPNSADSQFFIMLGAAPHLDGQYTVIGKVVEGFENVQKISQGDKIKTFVIQ